MLKTTDADPLIPVDREKLGQMVKSRTIFSMQQFERLIAWPMFSDAPQSRRQLAWELIKLPPEEQKLIADMQMLFPGMRITEFRDGATVVAAIPLVAEAEDSA